MKLFQVILFITTFQIINAQTNQEVLSLITESKFYLERKKYADAYTKINDALTLDNKNAEAFFIRGEINFSIEKYEEALKDYEKALELKNPYSEALNGKILSMTFTGKLKEALVLVDDAIKNNPSDPEFYFSRGIINNEREKYSKALDDLNTALSLADHDEFKIFLYRGVAKLNLEDYEGAMEDLNMALSLDPKNAFVYHSRGRVYYELKDFEQAIKDFEISLDFNPKNEVAYYNLGMAYFRLDKKEEACKYFRESCSMQYKNACKMIVVGCSD